MCLFFHMTVSAGAKLCHFRIEMMQLIPNIAYNEVTTVQMCFLFSQQLLLAVCRPQGCRVSPQTIQGSSHRRQSSGGKSIATPGPRTPLANLLGRDSHNVKHFLIVLWNVAAVERVQAPAAVWWCAGTSAEGVRCRDNAWSACSSTHLPSSQGSHWSESSFAYSLGWCVYACLSRVCHCRHVSCLQLNIFQLLSAVYFCISSLL